MFANSLYGMKISRTRPFECHAVFTRAHVREDSTHTVLNPPSNNNKKGTHMLPRGCSCYGDSLFGVRPFFGRRAV